MSLSFSVGKWMIPYRQPYENKKELEEEEIETKKCKEENRLAVTGGGNDYNLISGVWHRGSGG